MFVPEQIEKPLLLLRFLGEHMAVIFRESDDPAVVRARVGRVAVDLRRPRDPAEGLEFSHGEAHRESDGDTAVRGSERDFRLAGQYLDLVLGGKELDQFSASTSSIQLPRVAPKR